MASVYCIGQHNIMMTPQGDQRWCTISRTRARKKGKPWGHRPQVESVLSYSTQHSRSAEEDESGKVAVGLLLIYKVGVLLIFFMNETWIQTTGVKQINPFKGKLTIRNNGKNIKDMGRCLWYIDKLKIKFIKQHGLDFMTQTIDLICGFMGDF